jgi:hypothetical protein
MGICVSVLDFVPHSVTHFYNLLKMQICLQTCVINKKTIM